MVNITFKKNLEEYFIIGKEYIDVDGGREIIICTDIIPYDGCHGYHCGKNNKLGECDGQYKPAFNGYPDGRCAYQSGGADRFIRVHNTNERW